MGFFDFIDDAKSRVGDTLSTVVHGAGDALGTVTDKVSDVLHVTTEKAGDIIHEIATGVPKFIESVGDIGGNLLDKGEEIVNNLNPLSGFKPLIYIGGGLGALWILSKMWNSESTKTLASNVKFTAPIPLPA